MENKLKILNKPLIISKDFVIKNRLAMSSMSRMRINSPRLEVSELQSIYYNQRSEAGIIFSELINICEDNINSCYTPGLFIESQVDGWKRINSILETSNSKLFASLSHSSIYSSHKYNHEVGSCVLKKDDCLVPSVVKVNSNFWSKINTDFEKLNHREMSNDEILEVIEKFYKASKLAMKSGFAGISFHGTSGCLIERFCKSSTNKRSDKWGDKSLFLTEILKACGSIYPRERVAIKIGPVDQIGGAYDIYPEVTFSNIIKNASPYCKIIEIKDSTNYGYNSCFPQLPEEQIGNCTHFFKSEIRKNDCVLLSNFGTKKISDGINLLNESECDMISLATFWISNPKLLSIINANDTIILPNPSIMYSKSEVGYIDFK